VESVVFFLLFPGSVEQSNTIDTQINFRYLLEATDTRACDLVSPYTQAQYGFSDWLSSAISGLDYSARVSPPGQIDKVTYSGAFGVTTSGSAGANFNVIFLSANASDAASRNDIQSINFTIAPVNKKTNPAPTPHGGDGIGPAFRRPASS
jgi:hypothetical protein